MLKFSIVIPVYNAASYLRECLDSVLAQTFTDWEAICVDDGSTDGSRVILDEYAAKDRRFLVAHQDNAGVSVARNCGLNRAGGEWLAFLDSDDLWSPDLLAMLAEKSTIYADADIITYTPIVGFDSETGKREAIVKRSFSCVATGEEVLRGQTGKFMDLGWHSCDKVYRRSFIEQWRIRFNPNVSFGEDALFIDTLFVRANKVIVCNDVVGYYRRVHAGSVMHNISYKMWTSQVERFVSLYRIWQETHSCGVWTVLRRDVWSVVRIGLHSQKRHRGACIDFLLSNNDFNDIVVNFMFAHGALKQRIFAGLMKFFPRSLKAMLLRSMR